MTRERVAIAWMLATIIAFLGPIAVAVQCGCGPAQLTKKDRAEIVELAGTLEQCKAVGRDAGSYAAFERCLGDAGIR